MLHLKTFSPFTYNLTASQSSNLTNSTLCPSRLREAIKIQNIHKIIWILQLLINSTFVHILYVWKLELNTPISHMYEDIRDHKTRNQYKLTVLHLKPYNTFCGHFVSSSCILADLRLQKWFMAQSRYSYILIGCKVNFKTKHTSRVNNWSPTLISWPYF